MTSSFPAQVILWFYRRNRLQNKMRGNYDCLCHSMWLSSFSYRKEFPLLQLHSPPRQTNIWRTNTYTAQYRPVIFWPVLMNCIFFFLNLLLSFCLYIFCTNCFLLLLPDGNGYSAQPEMSMINYTKVIKLSTKQVGTKLLSTIYFRFYHNNMKSFFRNCWLDRAGSAATPWCWAPLHGHGANWRKNSAYAIESCVSTYYQMCKW